MLINSNGKLFHINHVFDESEEKNKKRRGTSDLLYIALSINPYLAMHNKCMMYQSDLMEFDFFTKKNEVRSRTQKIHNKNRRELTFVSN